MIFVTSGVRWLSGVLTALALGVVAWCVFGGMSPGVTILLLVTGMAPLVLMASLVGFRAEPLTATAVLHAAGPEGEATSRGRAR